VYAKIFSQIYDGTLCTNGPWEALVTFQQMLILADQDGAVDMTIPAIARRTTIPREIIERGVVALMEPDPDSRTPTEEGRRLVPLADGRTWGWRIVNYVKYRQIKREEDRREYHREYWHKRKLKDSTETQQPQPSQPIAYTEAKAKAEAETKAEEKTPRKRSARQASPASIVSIDVLMQDGLSEEVAQAWITHRKRKRADLTDLAWKGIKAEAEKAGWPIQAAIEKALARGWQSFDAAFVEREKPAGVSKFAGVL
jgi:hypothetical protein